MIENKFTDTKITRLFLTSAAQANNLL